MPGVTEPCAPFSVWKSLGRIPGQGWRSCGDAPAAIRRRDETGEQKVVLDTVLRQAFDVPYSNTVGPEVAWPELPEWEWQPAHAAGAADIQRVPFRLIDGNTRGYSHGRKFAISPVAVFPMKTLFREVGAHHARAYRRGQRGQPVQPWRGQFQAEAVAHLLAHELDLMQ